VPAHESGGAKSEKGYCKFKREIRFHICAVTESNSSFCARMDAPLVSNAKKGRRKRTIPLKIFSPCSHRREQGCRGKLERA
jgi:hypothetical protein